MEPGPRQAIDASHSCPNEHHVHSPYPLESRPEPMVIISRSVSETMDDEPRKRRRFADGDISKDGAEEWHQDAHMALTVRVADLQAKNFNITNELEKHENTNSALKVEVAELKIQAVDVNAKLLELTEHHAAQLKEIEKKYAKEVADLKAQHSIEVKELQDQNAKYKRVIAAWNA